MLEQYSAAAIYSLVLGIVLIFISFFRWGVRITFDPVSLRVAGVTSIWLGYHVTPLLAMTSGGWYSFLLRLEYRDSGVVFATMCMACFLTGYSLHRQRVVAALPRRPYEAGSFIRQHGLLICISFLILTVALSTWRAGGPSSLFTSPDVRGAGSFDPEQSASFTRNIIAIATSFAAVGLAFVSGALLVVSGNRGLVRWLVGIAGLAVSMVPLFWFFSRVSGFPLVLLAAMMIYMRKGHIWLVSLLLAGGFYLSWIGFTQRGHYAPGVLEFLSAALAPRGSLLVAATSSSSGGLQSLNFLNALDAWTSRAWTRDLDQPSIGESLWTIFGILQPVPSQLVDLPSRAGASLSSVYNTWGSTGLTTPALGELYYLFGFSSCLLLIPSGYLCAVTDHRASSTGDPLWVIFKVLLAAGFFIGLHSGLRAATRPWLYGAALIIAREVWNILFPRPSAKHSSRLHFGAALTSGIGRAPNASRR